jgi:perosamine synthetase
MAKPILISISPNTDAKDVVTTIKTIIRPLTWKQGTHLKLLSNRLSKLLNHQHLWLLNAGRSALEIGLKSLNLSSTDEVLCQAFTCIAVPNAIKWANAKPTFVDVNKNSFNLSLFDLKKKITKNSKALIIQHTFGYPDNLKEIIKICRKHKLILIEDCAHTLGVKLGDRPIGSFGDLTILSFGRDKVISSVFGGVLLTNNQKLAKKIDEFYSNLGYPTRFWIFKQLLHPIIMSLLKPIYFSIGKYLIFLYQKSGLLSWPVTSLEKNNHQSLGIKKLPNALASLAITQLNRLNSINQTRLKITSLYCKAFKISDHKHWPLLRFPLLVDQPNILIKRAKKHKILLGNWYRPVIAPQGVSLKNIGYLNGSCPNAEAVSQKVVNLPTLISLKQANQVIQAISQHDQD